MDERIQFPDRSRSSVWRACPARAHAQRGQRRTAVLIPDWLTVSTSSTSTPCSCRLPFGWHRECEHLGDVELVVAGGESGKDELGCSHPFGATLGSLGVEFPVGVFGGVAAADEGTDCLIDH